MKKRYIFLLLGMAVLGALWYGYTKYLTSHSSKLGETTFYKDQNMELKVVLIDEYLPLHYVGNGYSVACKSQNTKNFPEWKWDHIEQGWNRLPDASIGNGLGSDTAVLLGGLGKNAKKTYLVKDTKTIVILRSPDVFVSFDRCRTFTHWQWVEHIPPEIMVESTPDFETCVAQQQKNIEMNLSGDYDCNGAKFLGANTPVFHDVVASDDGRMSFGVTSLAFLGGQMLKFETRDFGKTWQNISGLYKP